MTPVWEKKQVLDVLVVGCGNIAGGYDQDRPLSELPLTHAGAYTRDGRFRLMACVDPDTKRRNEFMQRWAVPFGAGSLREILDSSRRFDVVSICSPTAGHLQDLEMALCLQPRLIFCEKPITQSFKESEAVVAACREAGVKIAVNYTRRWDPDVIHLAARIAAGELGALRSVVGFYNKGILNNGSHMVDLLHMLVGEVEVVMAGEPVIDHFPDDPTCPVWLRGRDGLPIFLACADAEDYALFELQLVFSSGVLCMEDGGLSWRDRQVRDSAIFRGYRCLAQSEVRPGHYPQAMLNAVDNIYRAIANGEPIACDGETAVRSQRLCERIMGLSQAGIGN